LKISAQFNGESQTLAQLQHTNIVPIYSAHRSGPLQAVCMPYFGSTTLADLLNELHHRPTLPDSGRDIVTVLRSRKQSSATLPSGSAVAGPAASEPRPALSRGVVDAAPAMAHRTPPAVPHAA